MMLNKSIKHNPILFYLVIITVLLFQLTNTAFSEFEIKPFKLKKLPPVKDKGDALDRYKVKSTLKEAVINVDIKEIGIRAGFPFIFGHIGGKATFSLPYVSFFFRNNIFNSKKFFLEYELGFLSYDSSKDLFQTLDVYGANLTASLVYKIQLSENWSIEPKLGFGYMVQYLVSNEPSRQSGFAGLITIQPSVEGVYSISKDFHFAFGVRFLIAQDLQEKPVKNLDYFLIPVIGVNYRF